MKITSTISIVFSTDYNQAKLCSVAVNSLVFNTISQCNIIILVDSDKTSKLLHNNIYLKKNIYLSFITVTKNDLTEFFCKTSTNGLEYLNSYMNLARFLIPNLIQTQWCLYLDNDVILQDDVSKLFRNLSDNYPLYAVKTTKLSEYIDNNFLEKLNIESEYLGFNTGVYLANLDYWRINKLNNHIKTIINIHNQSPIFNFLTQPILNLIFYKKYGEIDERWNCKDLGWDNDKDVNKIRESFLLHFNGKSKPDVKLNTYNLFWRRWKVYEELHKIRIVNNELKNKKFADILVTTYFTSKSNPQAGILSIAGDPNSIVPDYTENDDNLTSVLFKSVEKLNQTLIVFHDGLSKNYINKNQTNNIIFCKVELGPYSTNDERFFVYNEFIQQINYERIFFIDCFDVEIRKQPFDIFDIYGDRIYVGRDSANSIRNTPYVLEKLQEIMPVTFDLDHQDDLQNFLNMPLYNAGIIGGVKKSVNILINFICNILESANSKENVNMAVVNYAIYRLFLRDYKYIAPKDPDVNPLNDLRSCNDDIFSGYPLNSSFKKYEDRSDVYFIHK